MNKAWHVNVPGIGRILFERSSRARRIVISVRPRKGVRVAVPGRTSLDSAQAFVHQKKFWIQKQLKKIDQYRERSTELSRAFANIDHAEIKRKLTGRLKHLAGKHGFAYNRVTIRNQQTRWGSCSRKNNISLNLKLAVLPPELVDYVMLHELVHTRIHDHSQRFWNELDKYTGNGKAYDARLKSYDTRWV